MYEAYKEGKDLYAMIAQSAFNNKYEDNLEYYVPGEKVEVDGRTIIAGDGSERYEELNNNSITIKYYELVPTLKGTKAASDLKIGNIILTEDNQKLKIKDIITENELTTIIFEEQV